MLRTINKLESQKHFQKIAKKLAAEHNNNQQNHDFNKLDSMNIHDNMNIFLTEFIGKVLKNRSMDQCFLNNKHSGFKKLDPPKYRNVIRVSQFLCKMLHF